jgi:hypothetical protein
MSINLDKKIKSLFFKYYQILYVFFNIKYSNNIYLEYQKLKKIYNQIIFKDI